jgi:hypothetical protein
MYYWGSVTQVEDICDILIISELCCNVDDIRHNMKAI